MHFKLFPLSIKFGNLLRSVCDFIERFLLSNFNLLVYSIPMIFLIDLISQQLPIIFLHLLISPSLLLLPHIASFLLYFNSIRYQSFFLCISLLERTDILFGVVTLTIQQHLVILRLWKDYIFIGEVLHFLGLYALSHPLVVHISLLGFSLHLHSFLLIFMLNQLIQLLSVEVFIYFVLLSKSVGRTSDLQTWLALPKWIDMYRYWSLSKSRESCVGIMSVAQ